MAVGEVQGATADSGENDVGASDEKAVAIDEEAGAAAEDAESVGDFGLVWRPRLPGGELGR